MNLYVAKELNSLIYQNYEKRQDQISRHILDKIQQETGNKVYRGFSFSWFTFVHPNRSYGSVFYVSTHIQNISEELLKDIKDLINTANIYNDKKIRTFNYLKYLLDTSVNRESLYNVLPSVLHPIIEKEPIHLHQQPNTPNDTEAIGFIYEELMLNLIGEYQ